MERTLQSMQTHMCNVKYLNRTCSALCTSVLAYYLRSNGTLHELYIGTYCSCKFETLVGNNSKRYYQLNWQSTVFEINQNCPNDEQINTPCANLSNRYCNDNVM